MKSILVEFVRFKKLDTGILQEGNDYLCTTEQLPVRPVVMNLDQRPFNSLMKDLRYTTASEDERTRALETLSRKTSELLDCASEQEDSLGKLLESGAGELQQIDFVANAAELSGLPFESAFASNGEPLFLKGAGIVLTRRVRGAFAEKQPAWPRQPKVLFAWSSAGGEVPNKEHREALLEALAPWLPAKKSDREKVYVETENARLRDIRSVVEAAEPGFTHVHLLAHGVPVRDDNDDRFGIALTHPVEGVDAVTPEQLSEALAPIQASSVVVTLAACDLGNQTDSITPEKSVAHELHVSGIPVVIASQLPLTVEGSNILVRRFYRDLFGGSDVRAALHAARTELYENRSSSGHDWVSLVGYVRLNEGYANYLESMRLQSRLVSLDNLSRKAMTLAQEGASREKMQHLRIALEREIQELEKLLTETRDGRELDENRGLLGSAEKRLAEVCFHQFHDEESVKASREALKRARQWYQQAFRDNPFHHWTGVQYLALDAALTGTIDRNDWKTAYRAAEVERSRENEYWAHGSLAELALLGGIMGAQTDENAETYLQEMRARIERLENPPDYDPFESTRLQLRRYVDWWRNEQGFFPGIPDLASEAERLAGLL